ncbi:hypothetical protein J3P77_10225 [Pseudomonas sp. R1-18]|uniref:hypothetical protein n=1 Tax=Pseudomonas sp. R1-18 TaxID=1632772 RepID=UPI003DA88B12
MFKQPRPAAAGGKQKPLPEGLLGERPPPARAAHRIEQLLLKAHCPAKRIFSCWSFFSAEGADANAVTVERQPPQTLTPELEARVANISDIDIQDASEWFFIGGSGS